MKYAVIKLQGRQYIVKEGQKLLVDKLPKSKPEVKVLFLRDEKKVLIGKPYIEKAKVDYKVLEEEKKGEKIKVLIYKAKSRYRKRKGIRPIYSQIEITQISA